MSTRHLCSLLMPKSVSLFCHFISLPSLLVCPVVPEVKSLKSSSEPLQITSGLWPFCQNDLNRSQRMCPFPLRGEWTLRLRNPVELSPAACSVIRGSTLIRRRAISSTANCANIPHSYNQTYCNYTAQNNSGDIIILAVVVYSGDAVQ